MMSFKNWCREKWYQHCEEVESFTGKNPMYDSKEYFRMYKWWLKREYQHATRGEK
jgi:uncharacterized protein CbrC (UPF0167 family)